jgi:ABC-2 type transport system ATP-binding protein
MLSRPPILLLDEPTRSLDPLAAQRMRALILSLSSSDPPVTILLTSHNLTEVEELCARVAIISRGRIRALDTPKNLRDTHHQTERVELVLQNISRERAQSILPSGLNHLELTEAGERLQIAFTHETGDERLDLSVRALHEQGGRLVSFNSERATLLDVLESYEKEDEGGDPL